MLEIKNLHAKVENESILNEKLDFNIGLNEVCIFDSSEYKYLLISFPLLSFDINTVKSILFSSTGFHLNTLFHRPPYLFFFFPVLFFFFSGPALFFFFRSVFFFVFRSGVFFVLL